MLLRGTGPGRHLAGLTVTEFAGPFGAGGIGSLAQPLLGERLELVLKPNRIALLQAGDTLLSVAERYGTTAETLRSLNSDISATTVISTTRSTPPTPITASGPATPRSRRGSRCWCRSTDLPRRWRPVVGCSCRGTGLLPVLLRSRISERRGSVVTCGQPPYPGPLHGVTVVSTLCNTHG